MPDSPSTTAGAPPAEARSELRTFLIADVRGYTRFTQEQGDEAAARLVTRFAAMMREGVRSHGGRVVELRGDEALAVFGSARQAIRAAVDLQTRFAAESELDGTMPLPVGMGIDAGEAVPLEDGYRGEALNLAARLCNLAGPGEVLASEGVVYLGRRVPGVAYVMRGLVQMKGVAEQVRVIRVLRSDDSVGELSAGMPSDRQAEASLPIGGFLGALPSGALIGRDAEWGQIMGALEAVAEGTGRVLLLSGEPGIGKTRLAQELTLKARHWHFLVATGRCYELEQAVPFYPFLEGLATIYNAAPAFIRGEIPRRWPYLARLLPDLIDPLAAPADHPETPAVRGMAWPLDQEDQQRLFRAVTGFLTMVAETMPIALVLDDLHWADDSTLQLLQHLARYTRGHRVLLVGTYRDVEVHRQHPLETALLALSREHLVSEVEVRRLGPEGTAALVAEIIGEKEDLTDLAELVHRRTEGNAFFIQEVIRALMERGEIFRKDGHWQRRAINEMEVPKSIRAVIGQRLSQLDERSQEILRDASVLGQAFAFDDLQALVALAPVPRDGDPWTEDEIERTLEQAGRAGLLRETSPDNYAFNHALTQQTLYAELSTRRRKRLHLAAGQALIQPRRGRPHGGRERRAAELAWHFLEGDDAEHALPYSLAAGDQAEEVFANGDAERHYRTASELAHELCDRERELEALEKLAGILSIRGQYDKAIELLERAARLNHDAGSVEGEACAVAKLGHVHYVRGTREEGIARLKPLVDELDGREPSFGLASLWAALARLYMGGNRHQEELQAAERAVELARAIEHPAASQLIIGAEVTRSDALWEMGQEEETLRVMEELIPRAEAAGDLDNLARALTNAAQYYGRRGELEKDRVYQERAMEVAERRGDRFHIVLGAVALSQNAFLTGDWTLAHSYLDRADATIHALRSPSLSIWPAAARAWLALREGDIETALHGARAVLSLAESTGDRDYAKLAERLQAEHELSEGPESAPRALRRLEALLDETGSSQDTGLLRTLAWAYQEMGNDTAACETAAQAVRLARSDRAQPHLVEALAVHGMVMSRQGRWDEAEWDFAEARSLSKGMPFPFGEARALYEWGEMYRRKSETEKAVEKLTAARDIFQALGARGETERAQRTLEQT